MSKYTRSDIARIINDCEILFLPDGGSHESVGLTNEAAITLGQVDPKISRALNETSEATSFTQEDFEKIFYASKSKKQIVEVSLLAI